MKEETKEAATPTIAEKLGIKYKEVDGLFYPMWGESNVEDFATVGKYGHRWMSMLMEHDRLLYNQYFLDGTFKSGRTCTTFLLYQCKKTVETLFRHILRNLILHSGSRCVTSL